MVTKRCLPCQSVYYCFILAKNHMVTKPNHMLIRLVKGFILAKNHMVTKHEIVQMPFRVVLF